ncbi:MULTISPECIES: hypothetical protein [unclassified Micromonospora]|uniref:hypothetical protein n=1 Tax=unclassified Micromonospora TaxID=2617518 RepID=UPI00332D76E0
MITPESLREILDTVEEKIELCGQLVAAGDCDWDCCRYSDSYILLLPGEWESAQALGYTVDHYTVLDDNYLGGVKVVPRSMGCCVDPALGDRAYKSLDCRVFPFWFQIDDDELVLTQGLSCPIVRLGLPIDKQRDQCARVARMVAQDPELVTFLRAARMVNYEVVTGVEPVAVLGG